MQINVPELSTIKVFPFYCLCHWYTRHLTSFRRNLFIVYTIFSLPFFNEPLENVSRLKGDHIPGYFVLQNQHLAVKNCGKLCKPSYSNKRT